MLLLRRRTELRHCTAQHISSSVVVKGWLSDLIALARPGKDGHDVKVSGLL